MTTIKRRKKRKANKPSSSRFAKLLKDNGISQTQLKERLEEKEVYRDKMTIQRWCSGETGCRDLFVCQVMADVIGVDLKTVINVFKKRHE